MSHFQAAQEIGTGAPVTEQLRCRVCGELGWYRDSLAPIMWGGFFILYFIEEVIPMNPKPYGVNELREMFLSFFESKDHLRLSSFSLMLSRKASVKKTRSKASTAFIRP